MTPPLADLTGRRILIGVSSSIAAHRALDLASMLHKSGAEVRAVLTPNVPNLVGPAAFDAITHHRTIVTQWGNYHAGDMDHLSATKWADFFVICPATANTLATLAHGLAQDALGTFAVAWNKRPLLIVPAMNPEMWRNAAVAANAALLRERGHEFLGPVSGPTACDDVGPGRMVDIADVYTAIVGRLSSGDSLAGRRVVVTAGPTREFADDVRCITNPSSGRMGFALVEELRAAGAEVVLVLGPTPLNPPGGVAVRRVITADEMLAVVLEELPRADAVFFSAAVSDWRPAERHHGKEKKTEAGGEMTMRLVRTPDIAATAHENRRPGQVFVGFAAESTNLAAYAGDKMHRKGFQIVFANPVNESGAGFESDTNHGLLLFGDGRQEVVEPTSKRAIARRLVGEAAALLKGD